MANEPIKESDFGPLNLALALAFLRDRQIKTAVRLGDYNTEKDTLARYGNALLIEVAEFVNETPWKKWKDKPIDPERLKDEFADVLHFIGTWMFIMDLWGISATELAVAFVEKNDRNHRRLDGEEEYYGTPSTGYSRPIGTPEPTLHNDMAVHRTGVTHPVTGEPEEYLVPRAVAEANGWTPEDVNDPGLLAGVRALINAGAPGLVVIPDQPVRRPSTFGPDDEDDDEDEDESTAVGWSTTPADPSEGEEI